MIFFRPFFISKEKEDNLKYENVLFGPFHHLEKVDEDAVDVVVKRVVVCVKVTDDK